MDLVHRFKDYIHEHNLFQQKDTLLLAVSGGVDSVVLCELCKQAGYNFAIAHCNFKLRDKESERDREFVQQLAAKYRVDFFVKEFDTKEYAAQNKLSIQEAARELRYNWFYELLDFDSAQSIAFRPSTALRTASSGPSTALRTTSANPSTALRTSDSGLRTHDSGLLTPDSRLPTPDSGLPTPAWLLTAHHADDNIETLLMNFFRGTGIHGLRGMLPKKEKIVRPLLPFRKDELVEFADQYGLSWMEDSSNELDKYSRNYFRHQVIPLIEKIYPEVDSNLINNLKRFHDIELLYQQAIDVHKKKLLEQKGNEIHIPVLKLQKAKPLHSIVYEIVKDFNFSTQQVDEVISLLNSESGKYISSSSHRIIKNRNWLIITSNDTVGAQNILIEQSDKSLQFIPGPGDPVTTVQLDIIPAPGFSTGLRERIPDSDAVACLDAAEVRFPLLLRKWKQGDYFYPLGMNKKKKLSRFFIDQKLSLTDKEKVWVIEMNKKIIWVVRMRIDDRFKITAKTKSVLRITLKRGKISLDL